MSELVTIANGKQVKAGDVVYTVCDAPPIPRIVASGESSRDGNFYVRTRSQKEEKFGGYFSSEQVFSNINEAIEIQIENLRGQRSAFWNGVQQTDDKIARLEALREKS